MENDENPPLNKIVGVSLMLLPLVIYFFFSLGVTLGLLIKYYPATIAGVVCFLIGREIKNL